MKKILVVAIVAAMALGMHAQAQEGRKAAKVPAYPGIIERVQPNGDTLRTYLRGDEHKHWMMTEDGWQIKETKNGWYKYAKKNKKGEIVASCRKAKNADKRGKCEKKWLEKRGVKRG